MIPERSAGQRIALEMAVIYERQSQRMRKLARTLADEPADDCAGILAGHNEDAERTRRFTGSMSWLLDPDIKSPAFETEVADGSPTPAPTERSMVTINAETLLEYVRQFVADHGPTMGDDQVPEMVEKWINGSRMPARVPHLWSNAHSDATCTKCGASRYEQGGGFESCCPKGSPTPAHQVDNND